MTPDELFRALENINPLAFKDQRQVAHALIAQALAARERAVWLEAAKLAENKYNHRDPSQKASYRAGDFTLDYEAAGDAIAADCRQQAEGVTP